MTAFLRWAVFGLAATLLVAQGFRIEATNPPVSGDIGAADEVGAVLRRACYDCHSNETRWPWYSHVAPVSWLVAHDVDEGRAELNFSTWDVYRPEKRRKKLGECIKEIDEGEMPLWYYVLAHADAKLSDTEIETLRRWFESEIERLPPGAASDKARPTKRGN